MPLEGVHIDDTLQFVEEPVEIIEREIKRLKRSQIPLVRLELKLFRDAAAVARMNPFQSRLHKHATYPQEFEWSSRSGRRFLGGT
nr:putative reverse transcriptase domain-containing protein [Tanacetum cinerariifolium]